MPLLNDQQLYEETKLILLLAEDSEYAFQLIYDRYRNRVYQVAIRYLKSPIYAQEVVQDVFLKLWLERKKFNKDQPLEAWIYSVAKNNLLNRIKKIANNWKAIGKLKLSLSKFVDNADYKIKDAQYNLLLKNALEGLSKQQQKVFILARQEKLTYLQISEQMGISQTTVKTHMVRAMEHIKNYFSAKGEPLLLLLFASLQNLF